MSSRELPPVQGGESSPRVETSTLVSETIQAVPSSDAVLPSSPSPVKRVEAIQRANDAEDQPRKRPADDKDSNPENPIPASPAVLALQNKLTKLQANLASLQQTQATHIQAHNSTLPSGLPLPSGWTPAQIHAHALESANGVIKEHISLLHGYNEIKDVGMGLLGMVAETRGVRVKEIMEEFGIGEKD